MPEAPEPTSPADQRTRAQLPLLTGFARRLRQRRRKILPHRGPVEGEQAVGLGKSGALRAAIFGVNDGLVSNASLIMGVAGAGVSNRFILLAGTAGDRLALVTVDGDLPAGARVR